MTTEQKHRIEETLKPCPFCGGKAKFEAGSRGFIKGRSTRVTYIHCLSCNCRGAKYDIRGEKFTSTEARVLAINSWNYRFGEEN